VVLGVAAACSRRQAIPNLLSRDVTISARCDMRCVRRYGHSWEAVFATVASSAGCTNSSGSTCNLADFLSFLAFSKPEALQLSSGRFRKFRMELNLMRSLMTA
jgi:hypothetical protein